MSTHDKGHKHELKIEVRDGWTRGQRPTSASRPVAGARATGDGRPIGDAPVTVFDAATGAEIWQGRTGPHGCAEVHLAPGSYQVEAFAFGHRSKRVEIDFPEKTNDVCLEIPIGFSLTLRSVGGDTQWRDRIDSKEGSAIQACLTWKRNLVNSLDLPSTLRTTIGAVLADYQQEVVGQEVKRYYYVDLRGARGVAKVEATLKGGSEITDEATASVEPDSQSITGDINVSMRRTATEATEDLGLWVVIRKSGEALSFNNYFRFMNHVLCGEPITGPADFETERFPAKIGRFNQLRQERFLPFTDSEAYRLLKVATEAFVVVNCGVALTSFQFEPSDLDYVIRRVGKPVDLSGLWDRYLISVNGTSSVTLPYLALIRDKLRDVRLKSTVFSGIDEGLPADCFGILRDKLTNPCLLELIWSYWHEEGMLVQSVNAITRRFQNVRGPQDNDPLGNLEIDPLRPLNNLFWGYIQDEQHRLSVTRRNYEYDHHYGLRLEGRAVTNPRTADSRSKFLEAFHNLLHLCAGFFKQDDDTTVIADGFPVLNALKDVHLILSQGAHNQFGDLPSTARIEMLMQQWLMARPEFREFLPTRIMVAYPEPWMDRVDAMKKIQGWTDTSVLNFRNLGMFGEQVLLSIRYGSWNDVNEPIQATNWARFWRPEIQGYIHAYRSVTGIDLTAVNVGGGVDATLPSVLLRKRLSAQAVS
jgi:hypothetical protein